MFPLRKYLIRVSYIRFSLIIPQRLSGMVRENGGRFGMASKGNTGIIYVPSDLVKDSTFPLKEGDILHIRIDGDKLIVEKAKKAK